MSALDWDDLHILLAIAETGSLNAAAARLSVNHTTVLRRLSAIEKRLGTTLFERSPMARP
jgi:DNA-binding transcriptional LysR family regulator